MTRYILVVAVFVALAGCATRYATPGGPASLAAIDKTDIARAYARQPASPFPANIALIRLQDYGYRSYTNVGHNLGAYSVVTEFDIESDDALEEIESLPLVRGIAAVNRILLPRGASSIDDLRRPAAQLRADLMLIYSVDTQFLVGGSALGPFSIITLGLLPDKSARVTATVSGVLVDVRTGYIYGIAEASAHQERQTNAWRTREATDRARLDAESAAFKDFADEFQLLWRDVTHQHAASPSPNQQWRGYHVVKFPADR